VAIGKKQTSDIKYLLDTILRKYPNQLTLRAPRKMQVASLDFSSYVGRIAIGRVFRGDITAGLDYTRAKRTVK